MKLFYDIAKKYEAEAIGLRHKLHRIPEIGFSEHKTHSFIFDYMKALNPNELTSLIETGVKAVFLCEGGNGETVALRADMDALMVTERTGLPFASEHDGFMHACGHDAHMSIMLTVAKIVSENRDKLKYNVVFIFQPGEEGLGGARVMIEAGVLENPHVDRIYGFHVVPNIPVGTIGVKGGAFLPGNYGFDLTIEGVGAHGALPHMGRDAIIAAASLIMNLQTVVSRKLPPTETSVLTVGAIHGGKSRSVICDKVDLLCTLRTFSEKTRNAALAAIDETIYGIETMYGVICKNENAQNYPTLINNEGLANELLKNCDIAVPMDSLSFSEDFAFYCQKTKGLLIALGSGCDLSLHNAAFFPKDETLIFGISVALSLII
ncbi:MAG: M20 family metallopeptidase [Clostridia bacterium]